MIRGWGVKAKGSTYKPTPLPVPKPTAAPPVPRPVSPMPVDPAYDAQVNAAGLKKDTTLAGLQGQQQQAFLDYGYTPQTNAGGGVTGYQFDPTNVFSRAAILQRNAQQARQGNTTSYAARGQLYSGALQNAQDTTDQSELQSQDTLQKSLLRFIAGNRAQQTGAVTGYLSEVGAARGQSVANFASNPLYSALIDQASKAAGPPVPAPKKKTVKRPKDLHSGLINKKGR